MSKKALRLDEIGYWSEVKLDIIKKYASAYSTILAIRASTRGTCTSMRSRALALIALAGC